MRAHAKLYFKEHKMKGKKEMFTLELGKGHVFKHYYQCPTHLKVDTSKNHVAIKGISFMIKQTGLERREEKQISKL